MVSHHRPIQIETLQAVIGRQGIRLREIVRRVAQVVDLLIAEADQMEARGLPGPTPKQLRAWADLLHGTKENK